MKKLGENEESTTQRKPVCDLAHFLTHFQCVNNINAPFWNKNITKVMCNWLIQYQNLHQNLHGSVFAKLLCWDWLRGAELCWIKLENLRFNCT